MLTSQIHTSLDILFAFIPLQVTQLISSKNSRISWQTWQPCTTNFTSLAPCAQSYHCQDLHNNLSSPLIKQPAYLNSMLAPARNSRQLRSIRSNPLYIPRVKTKAGTRAFSVVAPTLWSSPKLGRKYNFISQALKISLKFSILFRFLTLSSIRRQLAHCYTITRLLYSLVLLRH